MPFFLVGYWWQPEHGIFLVKMSLPLPPFLALSLTFFTASLVSDIRKAVTFLASSPASLGWSPLFWSQELKARGRIGSGFSSQPASHFSLNLEPAYQSSGPFLASWSSMVFSFAGPSV